MSTDAVVGAAAGFLSTVQSVGGTVFEVALPAGDIVVVTLAAVAAPIDTTIGAVAAAAALLSIPSLIFLTTPACLCSLLLFRDQVIFLS